MSQVRRRKEKVIQMEEREGAGLICPGLSLDPGSWPKRKGTKEVTTEAGGR